MPTQKKIDQVARIKQLVTTTSAVYFADVSRLSARDLSELRRRFRKNQVQLVVAKNRLARRALAEAGVEADLAAVMRGPTSLVLSPVEEPYAAARLLREVGQRYREWQFKGAFVEGQLFRPEDFETLASMPTRPELYGQLLGVLMSPISGLAQTLEGLLQSLVLALDGLREQRAAATASA